MGKVSRVVEVAVLDREIDPVVTARWWGRLAHLPAERRFEVDAGHSGDVGGGAALGDPAWQGWPSRSHWAWTTTAIFAAVTAFMPSGRPPAISAAVRMLALDAVL